MVTLTIPGPPRPKQRARKGMGGHWYTPEPTRRYEAAVRAYALAARGLRWALDARYEVEVSAYFPDMRRRDADNVGKAVLDACNGVLWRDDSQVSRLTVTREIDRARPRTEVRVSIALPAEHFRCRARAATLLRSTCAGHYARVRQLAEPTDPDDRHCVGCVLGYTHAAGRVPTHAAPTCAPPEEPSLPARRTDPASHKTARAMRTGRACTRCGERFEAASTLGRPARRCDRCSKHRRAVLRAATARGVR